MKKILNFVKNNIFLILAAHWLINFAIGLITLNPSTLDATTRKIKALEFGLDLLFALVFFIQHTFYKAIRLTNDRIDLVNKRVDILFDAMNETLKIIAGEDGTEEESADKEEKEVN